MQEFYIEYNHAGHFFSIINLVNPMIYCVEDDESIRELIIYTLKSAGYKCAGFSSGTDFWLAMDREKPDLILLDIMLPGKDDGMDILKKLRSQSQNNSIPVIMTTAKGSEYDKVTGLDSGADDYLVKPFGMMELLSRIKALLRRTGNQSNAEIRMAGISINDASHQVRVDGQEIILTRKEYALLLAFVSNPGKVFSREQLLYSIWKDDFIIETRTVDVHVASLRSKIDPYGQLIKTVRGVGYKMENSDDQENL